jgi:hypothetical protein
VQPSALCKSVEAKPEPVIAEAMGVLRAIEFAASWESKKLFLKAIAAQ